MLAWDLGFGAADVFAGAAAMALAGAAFDIAVLVLAVAGFGATALADGLVSGLAVSAGLAAAFVVAVFAVLALPVDLANAASLVVLVVRH